MFLLSEEIKMKKKILVLIIGVIIIALAVSLYFGLSKKSDVTSGETNAPTSVQSKENENEAVEEESYTVTEMPSSTDFKSMVENFDKLEDGSEEKEELRKQIEAILDFAEEKSYE